MYKEENKCRSLIRTGLNSLSHSNTLMSQIPTTVGCFPVGQLVVSNRRAPKSVSQKQQDLLAKRKFSLGINQR